MPLDPSDPRSFLWNNLSRLSGVPGCRIWWWTTAGIPGNLGIRRHNFAMLSTEAEIRGRARIEQILRLIEHELALDGASWRSQSEFFIHLFQSFYSQSDGPAWIKVHAARRSFAKRNRPVKGKAGQSTQLGTEKVAMASLRRGFIPMNGIQIPARHLRLFHDWEWPDTGLHLQRIHVHRLVGADEYGRAIRGSEGWLIPLSNDTAEVELARGGSNPSLSALFRPDIGIQTSPLISLCRIDKATSTIPHCVFSLRPRTGQVVDFRETDYSAEFYFRSDWTCVNMLEKLTTLGEYELL